MNDDDDDDDDDEGFYDCSSWTLGPGRDGQATEGRTEPFRETALQLGLLLLAFV